MDWKNNMDTGIIEAYCLGLVSADQADEIMRLSEQYAEIRDEILAVEFALQSYAVVSPRPYLKQTIMKRLSLLRKEASLELDNLPLLHRHSNYHAWNKVLKDFKPDSHEDGLSIKIVKKSRGYQLCIIWLYDEVTENGHDETSFSESFLILEGTCTCKLGSEIIHLHAGDYVSIPPNTWHTIRNISEGLGYVKALVQRHRVI
jgi:mannose-6-phosphate isomerase-like protein (cupin superfamily)